MTQNEQRQVWFNYGSSNVGNDLARIRKEILGTSYAPSESCTCLGRLQTALANTSFASP